MGCGIPKDQKRSQLGFFFFIFWKKHLIMGEHFINILEPGVYLVQAAPERAFLESNHANRISEPFFQPATLPLMFEAKT